MELYAIEISYQGTATGISGSMICDCVSLSDVSVWLAWLAVPLPARRNTHQIGGCGLGDHADLNQYSNRRPPLKKTLVNAQHIRTK